MDIKTKVITISAREKGESDKLVTFFSLDNGLIDAIVKGARKQGAKLSACTFSFVLSEVVLAEKNGFYTLTQCDVIEPFFELSQDFELFEYASACLEFLRNMSRGNIDTHPVFVLLLQTLKNLCYGHGTPKLNFLKFAFELLGMSGYKLNLDLAEKIIVDKGHIYINLENGQFISSYAEYMIVAKVGSVGLEFLQSLFDTNITEIDNILEDIKDEKIIDVVFSWARVLCENLMGTKFRSFFNIEI